MHEIETTVMFSALFFRRGAPNSQAGYADMDTANNTAADTADDAPTAAAATGAAIDAAADAATSPTINPDTNVFKKMSLYGPKSQSEKIAESKSKLELSNFHRRTKGAKSNEIKA